MEYEKGELLYSGKAKSLYKTNHPGYLISEFRDDTSAFDGVKLAKLANKGRINNQISSLIFERLQQAGIPTHFVKHLSDRDMLVKHLTMIPLESVMRNMAAGSLCKRLGIEEKTPLDPALYEIFLKDDELHDPLVTENHALSFGWATREQLDQMKSLTAQINDVLSSLFADAGMMLVDAKYEFGVDTEGNVCLGDEISPDSCRIWDAKTQERLDKDRFRRDLGGVVESYQIIADRLSV
ncbi:MAG: phosphoribosylaminoimidazolesuccinocarboxamide synthase [Coxiellaceae bacterium]|nr:phosphoribosylaminoimidazolesuccinocarboxamide synthase [Coxiellaceae bacterium]